MKPDIVRRYLHNPILTKAEIPYPVETVHNAAVVKHENEYIMLFRSHLRTGRSIIGLARSPDGFHFTADPGPFLTPAAGEFSVEDPRVTSVEGEYLITYSVYSRNEDRSRRAADQNGPWVALHLPRRFPDYGRIGLPVGGRSS